MSTTSHSERPVPTDCVECEGDAEAVVVDKHNHESADEPEACCVQCAEERVKTGCYREYDIDEFYPPHEHRVADASHGGVLVIYDPTESDDEHTEIEAENNKRGFSYIENITQVT